MFAFYDRDSIQKTLEAMAEKGWILDSAGSVIWKYRKTEPKKYHVSVVYFPDASVYDSRPSDKEEFLEELCARDGWELKVSWGQMKIFYNAQENPTPIETDPLTQVENIHRAMKKKGNREAWLNLALGLYLIAMYSWTFFAHPGEALSQGYALWIILDGIILAVSAAFSLISWHRWYHKALKAAEEGAFLSHRSHRGFTCAAYAVILLMLILILDSFRNRFGYMVLCFIPVILTTIVVNWVIKIMKEEGASRKKNMGVSIAAALIVTLLSLSAVVYIAIRFHLTQPSRPVGTYEMYGRTWDVYDNDLPLEVEDLVDTDQKNWSRDKEGSSSLFASYYDYRQWALEENPEISELRYEITDVKVPMFYKLCRDGILRQTRDRIKNGEVLWVSHYEPADPAPWGAQEAWQLRGDYGLSNQYLLCFEGNRIVELYLWDAPTEEQMAVIGEKLSR